ncbi:MAG: biopolymer transporter ExbD, partial [Candidatus Aminicenantes bacterium]|nr:biopolymer transporter ExbD [Candidatus Aminicenantes bacterium]
MSVEIGSKSAKSEPNVVPLCDILLVLLIIFMVVTPMISKVANVTLPEAKYVASQPDPGQILTVF